MKKLKGRGGSTLLEVVVSIALLGLLVVPICSGLIMAQRINRQSGDIMEARLAVSSAVETIMALGVENADALGLDTVEITAENSGLGYWEVTVTSRQDESVSARVCVRSGEVRSP